MIFSRASVTHLTNMLVGGYCLIAVLTVHCQSLVYSELCKHVAVVFFVIGLVTAGQVVITELKVTCVALDVNLN